MIVHRVLNEPEIALKLARTQSVEKDRYLANFASIQGAKEKEEIVGVVRIRNDVFRRQQDRDLRHER